MRFQPSLTVADRGGVVPTDSGGYHWTVHRRGLPVAFLTSSLLGLADRDRLVVDVRLDSGTRAVITSQGPSALLKSARAVQQHWRFRLGPGAHLVFLPWHVSPFPGSRAVLRHDVQLADGASIVAWDVTPIGRVARGERFALEELVSDWEFSGAAPLLRDRLRLRGDDRLHGEIAFGGRTHVGSVYVVGIDEVRLPTAVVREALGDLELSGVSRPAPTVIVVRALDRSSERLEAGFWPVVARAQAAAGAPAFTPGEIARRWFGRV